MGVAEARKRNPRPSCIAIDTLPAGLKDPRSGRVVFVSHCLLNQNVRYLGGAVAPGAINEQVVATNVIRGEGWFITALRGRLQRRGIRVPFFELDLKTLRVVPLESSP